MKKTHPQEWQCPECNSKLVTLTNLFGSWPIEAYHSLSDLEKTSFWQQSSSGRQALKEAVEQKIVFKQIKQLVDSNVGKFLPMEAWVRKGWTPEAVAKCPTEIHPSGEKTYQVAVHTTGTKSVQELCRNEMAKLLLAGKKASESHCQHGL